MRSSTNAFDSIHESRSVRSRPGSTPQSCRRVSRADCGTTSRHRLSCCQRTAGIEPRIVDESSSASSLLNLGRPDGEQGRLMTRVAEHQVNPYAAHSRPSVPHRPGPRPHALRKMIFMDLIHDSIIVHSASMIVPTDGSITRPTVG